MWPGIEVAENVALLDKPLVHHVELDEWLHGLQLIRARGDLRSEVLQVDLFLDPRQVYTQEVLLGHPHRNQAWSDVSPGCKIYKG